MIRLKTGTWVLVADGEKALFLRNVGTAIEPRLAVARTEENDNPRAGEQGADRPGRRADPGEGQRSAVAETDWHRLGQERFAEDVAGILHALVRRGAFDALVLVVPPRMLGDLRDRLDNAVRACVIAEIDKDLTALPVDDIAGRVAAMLETLSG